MKLCKNHAKFSLLIALVVVLTFSVSLLPGANKRAEKDLKPVLEAYRLILEKYYSPEDIEKEKLVRAAIAGMLEELPDKHNTVFTKEGYRDYRESQEGNYVGVGMEIAKEEEEIVVLATFPGTPAGNSGLGPGYVIQTIAGKPTREMSFEEASKAIKGEEGTKVKLEVRTPEGKEKTVTLTRQKINIPPVELDYLAENRIGLLDVNRFTSRAPDELGKRLKELKGKNVSGYILDLRDNPGGSLYSAIEVASYFVDEGSITKLVSPEEKVKRYETKGNSTPNLPLALLINGGSASASELVAGAIRDHRMGVLVGRDTYGKGLVQTTHSLSNGFKLKLSTSEYLTPKGDRVHDTGLEPDIESPERSSDLTLAIGWIKKQEGQLAPLGEEGGQ